MVIIANSVQLKYGGKQEKASIKEKPNQDNKVQGSSYARYYSWRTEGAAFCAGDFKSPKDVHYQRFDGDNRSYSTATHEKKIHNFD